MEKTRLRVLSYNIHKGFSARNSRFVLRGIRDRIRELDADLVFLQEVLGEHEHHRARIRDWPAQSQFEFLADEVWPHFAYGKNAVYSAGHHGNAILSRFPFTSWENIDVSTNAIERRGLLHGTIEVPGLQAPLHAICVHLGLFEADRRTQVHRLCARVEEHVKHSDPLIVAGDFNDWRVRATATLERKLEVREAFVATQGKHARTFPCWLPALKLDRVYFRGAHIERARLLSGEHWSELSDHVGLLADFRL